MGVVDLFKTPHGEELDELDELDDESETQSAFQATLARVEESLRERREVKLDELEEREERERTDPHSDRNPLVFGRDEDVVSGADHLRSELDGEELVQRVQENARRRDARALNMFPE